MKVLMISGDRSVLNPQSYAGKRMAEYKEAFGGLDILLAYGSFFRFLGAFFSGIKMLLHKKYDAITAQSPEHYLLAWFFSKIFHVPWQAQIHTDILSPHFWQESFKNKIRVGLAKFLLPRADCVRAVSERIRKSLTAYGVKLAAILPIFVDTEKIKNAPVKTDLHKKYPGRFIILMASRITREKNIKLALETISLIRENKRITLLVVGDGLELPALRRTVYGLRLENNVIFEPHTDNLVSYYKTCDLFLLTSNYEGYGMTLVEAAAAGAKIISSDVGVAPEILELECIFKVGDKKDLAEKLLAALNQKLPSPKPPAFQTKDEYLELYKRSLEACANKK